MTYLILGLVIFFGMHIFSGVRSRADGADLRKKNEGAYMGAYSLVSLAGFALIVWGYGAARPAQVLYTPPAFLGHFNLILMALALILLASAYLPAGRIKKAAKHPMLAAVKLWAFGHLLANGELNSVLLFGSFLAYAVFARIAAKRRGDNGPGPQAAVSAVGDVGAIVVGLGAYAAIAFWLHPVLFGVNALPG